jgi:hypothetical protein
MRSENSSSSGDTATELKESGKGAEGVWRRLQRWSEEAGGPMGAGLKAASEASGQSRLVVWLLAVAVVVGLTVYCSKTTASALVLLLSLPYPAAESLAVMEVGEGPAQGVWLLYWLLWATLQAVPVPAVRLLLALWLQHPAVQGAQLVYHRLARPFLLLQHGLVLPAAWAQLPAFLAAALRLSPAALASPKLGPALRKAGLQLHSPPDTPQTRSQPDAHLLLNSPAFSLRLSQLSAISQQLST